MILIGARELQLQVQQGGPELTLVPDMVCARLFLHNGQAF